MLIILPQKPSLAQKLTKPKMLRPDRMVVLFRIFGRWPPDIFLFDELLRQWRDTEKEGLGLVQEKRYRHKIRFLS